jgi:hypothetical protein
MDLVVVVGDYRRFFEALAARGAIHRPPWLMSVLSSILPPTVVAFAPDDGSGGLAKCLIVSSEHLGEALGERRRDHFLLGRLVQKVAVVWARDGERRAWIEETLARARAGVLDWTGPYLDEPFDGESLGRRMLEVCYRGEVRPEAGDRASSVFEAQREHLREQLGPGLEAAADSGKLHRVVGGYRFADPPSSRARHRLDRYFLRSKARATSRWAKHVITFDNWLTYIERKVERRTGIKVELTSWERRWPVVFLWPRVIRVFLSRPQREGPR